MSRTNHNRPNAEESTIDAARIRMEETRREEKKAHERVMRTGRPEDRLEYFRLSDIAQAAQDKYREACHVK